TTCREWDTPTSSPWTAAGAGGMKRNCPSKSLDPPIKCRFARFDPTPLAPCLSPSRSPHHPRPQSPPTPPKPHPPKYSRADTCSSTPPSPPHNPAAAPAPTAKTPPSTVPPALLAYRYSTHKLSPAR